MMISLVRAELNDNSMVPYKQLLQFTFDKLAMAWHFKKHIELIKLMKINMFKHVEIKTSYVRT